MMRWLPTPFLLAPLLLCLAQPAVAGQRATYQDPEGKPMTIDVADNGDAVVRTTEKNQYGVWTGGQFYLVSRDASGWHVARIEDLAAAFDQVLPPIFKSLFGAAAKATPPTKLRIEPRGKRTVAGHEGQVYAVYGLNDEKPDQPEEFVMSREPVLAPAGKVMEQFLVGVIVPLAPMLGQGAADMAAQMRTIFTYGAPLDLNGRFKLLSVETRAVPASDIALPVKPDTVEQIVAILKAPPAGPAPE